METRDLGIDADQRYTKKLSELRWEKLKVLARDLFLSWQGL
jgi:hypothetical protein